MGEGQAALSLTSLINSGIFAILVASLWVRYSFEFFKWHAYEESLLALKQKNITFDHSVTIKEGHDIMRVLLGNKRVVVDNARKGRDRYVSLNIAMFSLVEVIILVFFHVA